MTDERETTSLWDDWEKCQAYHSSLKLSEELPRFVRFYEGEHWPAPTEKTKNLPRPVVNLVKMICRNKKSAILSTPVKLVYAVADENADAELLNRFAESVQKELGQEALDKEAVHDAVVKGPYIYHYYWDADARGMDGMHEGALRAETVDPLNIGFSNPEQRDEQKQKWILIRSREDVSSVRATADRGVEVHDICADKDDRDSYGRVEQEGDRLCTVLTRYFRKEGEVYYEKATRNVVFNQARPLAPDLDAARRELGFDGIEQEPDAPNNSLPDGANGARLIPQGAKAPLYPVVVGSYEPRERSIFGIGEVQGLIPNQKAINFMLAMQLLNAQEVAWGKYIVLPNALEKQKITNQPGQVLVDHSKTGSGIRKMTEQAVQTVPLQLVDSLATLTRTVTGSGEVMTGETISAGMSGAAIAQLQSQALLPVQELKEAFWLVKEKQGKVMAQFFKLFYHQRAFRYRTKVPQVDEQGAPILTPLGLPKEKEIWTQELFEGSDYEGVDFEVTVEATSGTKASAAGDISMLELLLSRNVISPKTFLQAYPKDALSNKSEILRGMEEDEADRLRQMSGQLEALTGQVAQYEAVIAEQSETVDKVQSVIRENTAIKELLAQLYAEAGEKVALANQIIAADRSALHEVTADAHDMAKALMDERMAGGASHERTSVQ